MEEGGWKTEGRGKRDEGNQGSRSSGKQEVSELVRVGGCILLGLFIGSF